MDYITGNDIPLPPPFRKITLRDKITNKTTGYQFYNECTQEILNNHPLEHLINMSSEDSNYLHYNDPISKNRINNDINVKKAIFYSKWKNKCKSGAVENFSLQIHFYQSNAAIIHFDGISGSYYIDEWLNESGFPITRYDLFIGNKVPLFGTNIGITGASSSVCEEIESAFNTLIAKQNWLIEKIKVSGNSVLKSLTSNYARSNSVGSVNLPQIVDDNLKLSEQLIDIGMGHLVIKADSLFPSDRLFWKT